MKTNELSAGGPSPTLWFQQIRLESTGLVLLNKPSADPKHKAIREAFKHALFLSCQVPMSEKVWDGYQDKYEGEKTSLQKLANRWAADKNRMTDLKSGKITFDNLCLAFTDLNWKLSVFDSDLPTRVDRFTQGYLAAIDVLVEQFDFERPAGDQLTAEQFLAISALQSFFGSSEGIKLMIADPSTAWETAIPNAKQAMSIWTAKSVGEFEWLTLEMARGLNEKWGNLVFECVQAMPRTWYSWAKREDE